MSRGFFTTYGAGTTDLVESAYKTGTSGKFSLSLWHWFNTVLSTGRLFDQFNSTTIGNGFTFFPLLGSVGVQVPFSSGSNSQWRATAAIQVKQWQNTIITYDASSALNIPTFYVNGVLTPTVVQATAGGTPLTLSGNYYIGNRQDGARVFDGMLAQFAVWNGVLLSDADAFAIGNGVSPLLVRPDTLSCYMPLDGVSNPEFDFITSPSPTIVGTRLGVTDPPILPIIQAKRTAFDYASFVDLGPANLFAYNHGHAPQTAWA